MRKTTIGISLVILAMILTACGSSGTTTANGSGSTSSTGNNSSTASRTPNPTTILAVGTFKLEGSAQAVDATEAAKLIPLWQLMNQLETSSSTAPQEVTAVVNAIQNTMTPAQIQAIHGMQISQRDVFTVLQESGALPAGGFGTGTGSSQSGTTRNGNGGNRGNGGGGLGFLFGGSPGGSATATRTPGSNTGTSGSGIGGFNATLITQLIKLLQSKAQLG